MNQLQPDVGRPLLRQLAGFRGYPRGEGQARFVDCLCEISLSVEHALAIIESFDGDFPTLREMRDTALNLRPKFEQKSDQRAEWKAKYGKPDPAWSRRLVTAANVNYSEERRAMLWQSIRDGIFYTETPMGRADLATIDDKDERISAFKFWRQAAQRNLREHPSEVAAFREQLNQTGWDELMVYHWANGEFPPGPVRQQSAVAVLERPIRQADIDAELRKQGREPGMDE